MAFKRTFGALRRITLSWCLSATFSASISAGDRNRFQMKQIRRVTSARIAGDHDTIPRRARIRPDWGFEEAHGLMSDLFQRLADLLGLALPPYGMAAVIVLLLYAVQSEIRFGAKARTIFAGASDRGSTFAVSLSSIVPVIGFVLAMQTQAPGLLTRLSIRPPDWLLWPGAIPGMIAIAWLGVSLGGLGLLIRLWAVLTLRKRYTRTLLVQDDHAIERGGPYRFVRHPGYLGSLLCLNGFALASCSAAVVAASVAATFAAYAYRIRVEDAMLVAAFGERYENYRREVGALLPFVHP